MGQESRHQGHIKVSKEILLRNKESRLGDFVLEKNIFSNIFEKDIRKVFIYKKSERLAKAVHLIGPAFAESVSLRNRIESIAIGLVDAAILPSAAARSTLSRELLALSSVLAIARTSGIVSAMNADLIAREVQLLLQEITAYEEPRLTLDEAPTLSNIAQNLSSVSPQKSEPTAYQRRAPALQKRGEEHIMKDKTYETSPIKDRRDGILSIIKNKGLASIKDISMVIRGVSEKTIQRELQALVEAGLVIRQGERRWSRYALA